MEAFFLPVDPGQRFCILGVAGLDQSLVQSLDLVGTGTTLALSFTLPVEMFDLFGAAVGQRMLKR